MSAVPPLRVEAGWYWFLVMPQDVAIYSAFLKANPAVRPRKVYRSQGETNEIVVFQVLSPVAWTLATPPSPAPKGFRTELADIIAAPPPSPHWTIPLSEFAEAPFKAAKEASSALSLVLWGGAAILLFNLYRSSRSSPTVPRELDGEAP